MSNHINGPKHGRWRGMPWGITGWCVRKPKRTWSQRWCLGCYLNPACRFATKRVLRPIDLGNVLKQPGASPHRGYLLLLEQKTASLQGSHTWPDLTLTAVARVLHSHGSLRKLESRSWKSVSLGSGEAQKTQLPMTFSLQTSGDISDSL